MKKKAIEKVPYLMGKKIVKREKKYVATVALKIIGHEKHLLIEIYENKKNCLSIPVIRCVYTQKEWGMYEPGTGIWSQAGIEGALSVVTGKAEIGITENDIEKISKFTKTNAYNKEQWWQYLELLQDKIKHEKYKRHMQKRMEHLQARCAAVGELPEDFEEWYKNKLFARENFIYYRRKGRYATFWCSHCGGSYKYATSARDTFEGQFEKIVRVPRNRERGRCELCDAQGYYKPVGNMKNKYGISKECYVGQQYNGTGLVSRYIHVEKVLSVGEPESFIVCEIARSYFEKGKVRIKDYYLHNGWTGKNEWHDHNIGGMGAQIQEKEGYIYPGTYEELKKTELKYCALQEYMQQYDVVRMADYLEMYNNFPSLELLVKSGMHMLVKEICERNWTIGKYIKNKNAVSFEEALGINKQHRKLLIEHEGAISLLGVLQMEKELGQTWTDEQCQQLSILNPDETKLDLALKYMTIQKFLNHVQKYAGVDIGDGMCGRAIGAVVHTSLIYLDYLQMRNQRGYDLNNTVYLYPRELDRAHQIMVEENEKGKVNQRLKEVEERYPYIRRRYRKLRKKYFYEDETMVIRPAKSAEEIVMEGRILHHCVGGDDYLSKHNEGESIILFLRYKTTCNVPYITVEIQDEKIKQWYGEHDTKPDETNMKKWLQSYIQWLKKERKEEQPEILIPAAV